MLKKTLGMAELDIKLNIKKINHAYGERRDPTPHIWVFPFQNKGGPHI
jgi:hypothetical protein